MDLFLKFADEFTEEDRERCIKTVEKVLDLAEIARMEGLLALESAINEIDNFFFNLAVNLIIDGTDPVIVEEVLNNFILSGGYSSFEKLNACIITRGLLYVQSGENKEIIRLKLASMLGEKLFKTMMSTNQKERYLAALAKLESDKPEPLNESRQFELRFLEMNDNTIQMILRYITNEDCVKAFSGCSYKGIHKMLNNLSLRYGESILDGINCCNAGKQDISDAQERILEKINELEKNG